MLPIPPFSLLCVHSIPLDIVPACCCCESNTAALPPQHMLSWSMVLSRGTFVYFCSSPFPNEWDFLRRGPLGPQACESRCRELVSFPIATHYISEPGSQREQPHSSRCGIRFSEHLLCLSPLSMRRTTRVLRNLFVGSDRCGESALTIPTIARTYDVHTRHCVGRMCCALRFHAYLSSLEDQQVPPAVGKCWAAPAVVTPISLCCLVCSVRAHSVAVITETETFVRIIEDRRVGGLFK